MRFTQGRRRAAPSVIIVSLIDVLLVVLIFLMVSTTFRQTPSVKLALPEAKHSDKAGASPDKLVITIAKSDPPLYVGKRPVTFDKLQEELAAISRTQTNLTVAIQADEGATWGQIMQVMQSAKAANIKVVDAVVRTPSGG
jgi:biopolymer transport protein ExbD